MFPRILISVFCALGLSPAAFAQIARGALNGTVTASKGSIIQQAKVMVQNLDTSIESHTTTTDAGVYRLPYLPLGNYKITVSASGFQNASAEKVALHVAQTLTVNFSLQPDLVKDTVPVTAEPRPIESGTAETGHYVTKTEFDTWPILTGAQRQIQTFIFSSLPGTFGGTGQGSINGGQYFSHEILIEGLPVGRFDIQGGSADEFGPNAESISEFRLQTGIISAQYGGGQTSIANFAIRSGANDFHGSAFTYLQNDVLRANSFSNKATNRPRPPFKLLNYGYSLGGPVWLPQRFFGPMSYQGRGKTFFFHSLESTRIRNFVSTSFTTLPVRDFKQGNFARLLNPSFTGNANSGKQIGSDALGRPIIFGQLYDPRTTRLVNGVVVRDPFPGNIVPASAWSSVSRNVLERAGITDPLIDRMLNNIPALGSSGPILDSRIWGLKLDHLFNDRHRVSGYYNHNWRERFNSPGGRWGIPPERPTSVYQIQSTPGRMVRIAYDWTLNSSVTNHAAFGYNRFGSQNQSASVDQGWPSQIGLQNVPDTHFPALYFDGADYQGGGIGAGGQLGSSVRTIAYNGSTILADDLTITSGNHHYKMGVELRKYYSNLRNKSGSGDFLFSPVQTELPGFSAETGHAFASFLLGAVADASREIVLATFGYRTTHPSFYFMDDWKLTPRLTLNLGLRWEMNSGYNEVAGRMSTLDLKKPNPEAGGRPGAVIFADESGRRGFHNWYRKMISPRIGFAWAVNPRMVIRGGYGINSNPLMSNFQSPDSAGYSGTILVNQQNFPTRFPADPVLYWQNPFPNFPRPLPDRNPAQQNNLDVGYIAPDSNRVGYAQNYSLGIQYLLPAEFVLEAGYTGNKGTRLEADGLDNLNELPVSALRFGDKLIEQLSDNPGLVPLPYAGFDGTVAQALRPFPQYGYVYRIFSNFGTSHYDSLQIQLTRYLTRGISLRANYAWSKAIFTGSESALPEGIAQSAYNRQLEKSITSFSIPHNVKLTWIYDLPFGKGKRWQFNRLGNAILGGWTLTGIQNYRAGDPLTVTTSNVETVLFNGVIRPDWISTVKPVLNGDATVALNGRGELYLNPAAFRQVPVTGNGVPLRLGTAPPRLPNIRGPHVFTEDLGLHKRFDFSETSHFEMRFDFFNAFNRSGRGNPVTNITSPLFGRIVSPRGLPRNIQVAARLTF